MDNTHLRDLRPGDLAMVKLTRYTRPELARLAATRPARVKRRLADGQVVIEFESAAKYDCGQRFVVRADLLTLLPPGTRKLAAPQPVPAPAFTDESEPPRRLYAMAEDGHHNGKAVGVVLLADRHAV